RPEQYRTGRWRDRPTTGSVSGRPSWSWKGRPLGVNTTQAILYSSTSIVLRSPAANWPKRGTRACVPGDTSRAPTSIPDGFRGGFDLILAAHSLLSGRPTDPRNVRPVGPA